ncbi:MAG: GNAT family N-acetyltransferase [Alphaproteobacteria bacterium]|nr:GNAT family N-acetyltransferase [Alphaproteobacteria bacterium]
MSALTVEVHREIAPALAAWEELEQLAPASIYQTRRFIIPRFDTMGRARNMTPLITIVRENGEPRALLPFAMEQAGSLRSVEFLGGRDSNANLGLYAPGAAAGGGEISKWLQLAAAQMPERPDIFILANQPESWEETPNPLLALPHQSSPSHCYSTALIADSEAFHRERLSSDARKKLRWKRKKLEELGPVSLLTARTEEEARRILEAFFAQKLQRFDDKNISSGFDSPQARAFFERCCVSHIGRRDASVELHALLAGERIVATYGGGLHRGRFHCMFNSFDLDPQLSRYSPGDILLSMLIESKCRQGVAMFDLGIGEARYKNTWCDRTEKMFDIILPLTAKGHAWAMAERTKRNLKRAIKQSSWAWPLAMKIREKMRRKAA